ncbi:hypothetical protein B0H63DRAFT_565046 [Podospora didyma]|uniref:Mid2 domain-containing protein n=1 Tax=Podospora didyma TaxID=330526 RepID=A0AAE0K1H6_9PEZI|nr:hypothetical protein B0H63DRAFT_565046 [Podospora didyma]
MSGSSLAHYAWWLLPSLVVLPVSVAQTEQITCYGLNGDPYYNNTQCPGSKSCCGHKATCLSNRLCHNPGDPPNLWVRGPCMLDGWDSMCGQICLYDETKQGGGRFPRVTQCNDGTLCCNNDPDCCANGRGVYLDATGSVALTRGTAATTSYPPVSGTGPARFTATLNILAVSSTTRQASTFSSTRTSTASSRSTSATSSTSTSTPTSLITSSTSSTSSSIPIPANEEQGLSSDSGPDPNIGTKVGLGLGIPLVAIMVGLLVYLYLRQRRKVLGQGSSRSQNGQAFPSGGMMASWAGSPNSRVPGYYAASSSDAAGGNGFPSKFVYGSPPAVAEVGDFRPVELDTTHRLRHELG